MISYLSLSQRLMQLSMVAVAGLIAQASLIHANVFNEMILVSAESNEDLMVLSNDVTVNLAQWGDQLSITAGVTVEPASVSFSLTGPGFWERIENHYPFALKGDNSGNYAPWKPLVGPYVLTMKAYSESEGQGEVLDSRTIHFSVIDDPAAIPYQLRVKHGRGGGEYVAGESVKIRAKKPPEGKVFDQWIGDVESTTNTYRSTTHFITPARDSTVEATFRNPPARGTVAIQGKPIAGEPFFIDLIGPTSSPAAAPNSFLDFRYQATLTGPNDETYTVPGFFVGNGEGNEQGDVWRVAFTPIPAGEWSYQISFRSGKSIGLDSAPGAGKPLVPFDGATGAFMVDAPKTPTTLEAPAYASYWANFIEEMPATRNPVTTSGISGPVFAIGETKEGYALLSPTNGGPLTLDLSDATGTFSVHWFDLQSGVSVEGEVQTITGGETADLGQAPYDTDRAWGVLIKKRMAEKRPSAKEKF